MNETTLKKHLLAIRDNDWQAPEDPPPFELAQAMLAHIGTTDPELRDDLIYAALARWIDGGVFDHEQLRRIWRTVLDNQHLFYRLGAAGDDSVFTRSFSALQIPPLIIHHRRSPYLQPDEVQHTLQRELAYLAGENDRRGYVREKGWAHAVAHAADGLDDLAQCQEIDEAGLLHILQGIQGAAAYGGAPYAHEEDERLAFATLAVLRRRALPDPEITAWLRAFVPLAQFEGKLPERHLQAVNVKHYLRSLYFQARKASIEEALVTAMLEVIEEVSRF